MVFYPLVIRDAVEHYRKIGTVLVGTDARPFACAADDPPTVDCLLRKPTMAVKKVSFRGWYFSPLPSYPDGSSRGSSSRGRSTRDETLGETLSRMKSGDTLRDVFSGGAVPCRRRRRRMDGPDADRPSRANASLLHGEGEGEAARRIRTISRGSHGGSSGEEDAARVSTASTSTNIGSLRNPSFHPVDTSAPSRGCMWVRTLEESLAVHHSPSSQPSEESSHDDESVGHSAPSMGGSSRSRGLFGRMSPRRDKSPSAKEVLRDNMKSNSSRSVDLGTVRFGRTGSTRFHSIRYGSVEIREYSSSLGDHPACSEGPPISLGWSFRSHSKEISVDDYESSRPPRRHRDNLKIPKERRERILRNQGYSYEEILQAIVDKRYDQVSRERTLCRLKYQAFDERMEEFRSAHFCSRT